MKEEKEKLNGGRKMKFGCCGVEEGAATGLTGGRSKAKKLQRSRAWPMCA